MKTKSFKLKEVDDKDMLFSRVKRGKGFSYLNESKKTIRDKKAVDYFKSLGIPPMWEEVHICKHKDGHIQAIGRDKKGRKQYIYHPEYEKNRQAEKFLKMYDFASFLPDIRKRAYQDIKIKEWHKEKVLALLLLVLDEYGVRVGNKQYLKSNQTVGLTTLRRKHMTVEGKDLVFQYKGKSSQEREVHIDDPFLIPFIKECAGLPGYEIFRYQDDAGKYHDIDSDDVNEYITTYMGSSFSSKDFRTWSASRLAIDLYPDAIDIQKTDKRKKFANILIGLVASELGNTPTVCREYYVHPNIFKEAIDQRIPHPNPFKDPKYTYELSASEQLAVKLIH